MTATKIVRGWYGPTLLHHHRVLAIRRITRKLLRLAGRASRQDPETWTTVATDLGIELCPVDGLIDGIHHACLKWDIHSDGWILQYDVTRSLHKQSQLLVHELAHFFQHDATAEWLCDEPAIYYYEGPVWLEQHIIAREIERRIAW